MIKNIIISIIIITISTFNSYTLWTPAGPEPSSYLALANAAIGILGVLLLIGRLPLAKVFVFLWIVFQFAVVELNIPVLLNLEMIRLGEVTLDEINCVQYLAYFPKGAEVMLGEYFIRFNIVPLAYLFLLLVPITSKTNIASQKIPRQVVQTGEFFDLRLFRWNTLMERIVPQRVEVLRKVDFADSKNWFLVRFSKPIKFKGGRIVRNALIKPKDGRNFVKSQPGQLGYFRLIGSEKSLDLSKTRFIDWVLVK